MIYFSIVLALDSNNYRTPAFVNFESTCLLKDHDLLAR